MISLEAAIQSHKGALIVEFKRQVKAEHSRLYHQFGRKLLRVSSPFYSETVSPCCVNVDALGKPTRHPDDTIARIINGRRLNEVARRFALDVTAHRIKEIHLKLSDLDKLAVHSLDLAGTVFVIGEKGRHLVAMRQYQIFKCSARGNLVAEYTSWFFVDGKPTAEADFATAIAS